MRVEPHALVKTRRFLVVHLPAWVGLLLGLRSISASALEPPAQANAGTPTVFTADERAFVAAAIDRLVHHCVILELNIPSYRMEEAKKNRDSDSAGKAS